MWPSIQSWQCTIDNGTLESLVRLKYELNCDLKVASSQAKMWELTS